MEGQGSDMDPTEDKLKPGASHDNPDLLIRFFESQFFNGWIAITYLFKNLGPGTHDYLCNRIYTLPESEIELYLSQLCQLCVLQPGDEVLERVLVDLCTHSLRIAVKLYWLLYAVSQDNPTNLSIVELRDRCEQAALAGDWALPFRSPRLPKLLSPFLDTSLEVGHDGARRATQLSPIMSPQERPSSPQGGNVDLDTSNNKNNALLPNPTSNNSQILGAVVAPSDQQPTTTMASTILLDTGVEGLIQIPTPPPRGTTHQTNTVEANNAATDDGQASANGESEKSVVVQAASPAIQPCIGHGGPLSPIFSPPNSPQRRHTTFGATIDLLEGLCTASSQLTTFPADARKQALLSSLERINTDLERATSSGIAVWFPLGPSPRLRVVRLAVQESQLLNSKDKAPFTVFVEVLKEQQNSESSTPNILSPAGSNIHCGIIKQQQAKSSTSLVNNNHLDEKKAVGESSSSTMSATAADGDHHIKHGDKSLNNMKKDTTPTVQPPQAQTMLNLDAVAAAAAAEGIPWVAHHHRRSSSGHVTENSSSFSPHQLTHSLAAEISSSFADNDMALTANNNTSLPGSPISSQQHTSLSFSHATTTVSEGINSGGLSHEFAALEETNEEEEELYKEDSADVPISLLEKELHTKLQLQAAGVSAVDLQIKKPSTRVRHARTDSMEGLRLVAKQHKLPLPPNINNSSAGGSSLVASGVQQKQRKNGDTGKVTLVQKIANVVIPNSSSSSPRSSSELGIRSSSSITLVPRTASGREMLIHPSTNSSALTPTTTTLKSQPAAAVDNNTTTVNTATSSTSTTTQQQQQQNQVVIGKKADEGVYGEKWLARRDRIQHQSPYGKLPGWDLCCVIIKSGDDCRQELLAVQLVAAFKDIFVQAGLPLWVKPYEVLVTSNKTAVIEMVPNAPSLHAIKAAHGASSSGISLRQHLINKFGQGSRAFKRAQKSFAESLAGYSLFCYLLQVKDRHNGNILMDDAGHLVHIDFGYMLSNSPGNVGFETAPFKLTREFTEVMDSGSDGQASEVFDYFKVLMIQGFLEIRKHSERITLLVEMMSAAPMPCFVNKTAAVNGVKKRMCLNVPEKKAVDVVLDLIRDSLDAWSTRQYDYYQRLANGIL